VQLGAATAGAIAHLESPLWKVTISGTQAIVQYKVRLQPDTCPSNAAEPFLNPTGGVLGDLHMFLYLVESPQTPARDIEAAIRVDDINNAGPYCGRTRLLSCECGTVGGFTRNSRATYANGGLACKASRFG
jgi:hypothetical protein